MSVMEKAARVMDRVYDRLRDPAAFKLRLEDAVDASFETLRGQKYGVLVTFRRSGEPVPSPVWFGLDDEGRAYVHTTHDAGKVKRISNDPRALIAASNMRGKPKGAALAGVARIVPKGEWAHAEAALAGAYGVGRKIYIGAFSGPEDLWAYLEISPGRPSP